MTKKVDKDFAPEGYEAKAVGGCAFDGKPSCDELEISCAASTRPDCREVIFVPKQPEAAPLDINEAPEGFVAQLDKRDTCSGCYFSKSGCAHVEIPCAESKRVDGNSVIFVKKGEEVKPQLPFDKNYAPEGFTAVLATNGFTDAAGRAYCDGCYFSDSLHCGDEKQFCLPKARPDGLSAIFIKKDETKEELIKPSDDELQQNDFCAIINRSDKTVFTGFSFRNGKIVPVFRKLDGSRDVYLVSGPDLKTALRDIRSSLPELKESQLEVRILANLFHN